MRDAHSYEHQRWQDELAADLAERDDQREPAARQRRYTPVDARGPSRGVLLAGLADQMQVDTTIAPVACPRCNAPVFAPADSDRELITCTDPTCRSELVTRRGIEGLEVVERDGGGR